MKILFRFPARRSVFLFLLVCSMTMTAQQTVNSDEGTSSGAGVSKPVSNAATPEERDLPNEPLTFRNRVTEYAQSTFYPSALLFPAISASYNQLRNYPPEWPQGGQGYGKRLLSAYGSLVADNTITFGVAALDHEDLRYVRSTYPRTAILRRAGYAIAHTFVSRLESGGHTLAWSRLAGAYGAGFIANTWYPEPHSTLHNAAYLGTFNFATDVGYNLLKEFIRPHFVFGPEKKSKPKS